MSKSLSKVSIESTYVTACPNLTDICENVAHVSQSVNTWNTRKIFFFFIRDVNCSFAIEFKANVNSVSHRNSSDNLARRSEIREAFTLMSARRKRLQSSAGRTIA